jgi:hypothetical protein
VGRGGGGGGEGGTERVDGGRTKRTGPYGQHSYEPLGPYGPVRAYGGGRERIKKTKVSYKSVRSRRTLWLITATYLAGRCKAEEALPLFFIF